MFALFCIPWAAQAQSLFSEDFESGSMPTGWTTDGPGTWQIGTGDYSTSTGAGQGTYNALIKHGTTGNVTKLITPEIDLSSVSSALLSFMHVQRSWAGDIDNLRVYYRTSSSETWTLLTEYTTAISIWTAEEDIVLPNTSSTYQIAFECTDNYGYGVGIDYVQILAPSSCARPTALTSSDVTAHAATISWTSDASAWQVCLNDDENNLINVTTTSHTFSGLTAETTYSVKVRTNCNGTYSNWTSPVSFTTAVACPVPTLAYSGAVTNLTAHSGMVSWTENGSATEWVVAYKPSADTEFEEVTVTENSYVITNLEPETSYIVKVKAVCGGIDGESEWSDTRTFTTTVACPAPTNLQCNGATLTTATLSWFEGEATQWEVCLNDDEDNLISVFDSPTITIENLSPGTTYSFKVRAICDSASAWSSSFSFTTVFAIPMVQPFDATSIPAGWKMYTGLLGTDGTANLTSTTYGWTFGTGNGVFDSHARVNIYNTYQRWLVTPYLEMENNVRLTFDLALTAYSGTVAAPQTTGTDDKFAVLITTDNGSTWEVLRQWDNAGSEYVYNNITCSADGEFVNLDLSSYAGQNVAIAFYGESTVSNADNNLHIDNVTIEYIPSCEKPVALAVNYTGGTEATISWTSDAENFTLQYYNDFEESEEIEVDQAVPVWKMVAKRKRSRRIFTENQTLLFKNLILQFPVLHRIGPVQFASHHRDCRASSFQASAMAFRVNSECQAAHNRHTVSAEFLRNPPGCKNSRPGRVPAADKSGFSGFFQAVRISLKKQDSGRIRYLPQALRISRFFNGQRLNFMQFHQRLNPGKAPFVRRFIHAFPAAFRNHLEQRVS